MKQRVCQWGNSLAVRIPAQIARSLGWVHGSAVQMSLVQGILSFHSVDSRRMRLKQLLARSAYYWKTKPDLVARDLDDLKPGNCLKMQDREFVIISALPYNHHEQQVVVVPVLKTVPRSVFGWILQGGPLWGTVSCDSPQTLDLRTEGIAWCGQLSPDDWFEIRDRLMAVLDG